MDHIGIDVHEKESQICVLGEDGQLSEPRIRTTPERFAAVLGDRRGPASSLRPRWRAPTGSGERFIRRVLALRVPGRLLSDLAPRLAVMGQVNQPLADSAERIAAVASAAGVSGNVAWQALATLAAEGTLRREEAGRATRYTGA